MAHPHLLGELSIGYESRRASGYFFAFCIYKLNYYFYYEETCSNVSNQRGLFYTGLTVQAFTN